MTRGIALERGVPVLGALSVVLVLAAFVGAVAAVPLLFFGGYWRAIPTITVTKAERS